MKNLKLFILICFAPGLDQCEGCTDLLDELEQERCASIQEEYTSIVKEYNEWKEYSDQKMAESGLSEEEFWEANPTLRFEGESYQNEAQAIADELEDCK